MPFVSPNMSKNRKFSPFVISILGKSANHQTFSWSSLAFGVTFLGVVQGLTEFLPVSSSGHLSVIQSFFLYKYHTFAGWGLFGDLTLHLGTLIAAILFFLPDVKREWIQLMKTIHCPEGRYSRAYWLGVGLATGITGVIGLVFHDQVERAFTSPLWITLGFVVTGLVLISSGMVKGSRPWSGSYRAGLKLGISVGLAQGAAIWPGISRSGMTIVAGLACGLTPLEAFQFSFFTGIPLIAAAWVYDLLFQLSSDVGYYPLPLYLWAVFVSGITGWFALNWLKRWTVEGRLQRFGWYCLGLSLILGLVLIHQS